MRTCLSPFFIGMPELGLDTYTGPFDVVIPACIALSSSRAVDAVVCVNVAIRDFVTATICGGQSPLILSGDCLACIGCLAGLKNIGIQPFLLWVDAHGDFHTPATSISGHLGGMPLAMITGRGDLSILEGLKLESLPDKVIYHVGARDLEIGELESFQSSKIRRIDRIGKIVNEMRHPIWVHFDMDYINLVDAPAMRYPVPGGPSATTVKQELSILASTGLVIGISVSAWAPHLDPDGKTARNCWDILRPLLR